MVLDQAGDHVPRPFVHWYPWLGWKADPSATHRFPDRRYVLAAAFDVASVIASKGSHSGAARDAFVAATYIIVGGGVVSFATALTGFWDWWKGLERHPSSGPIGKAAHTQGLSFMLRR